MAEMYERLRRDAEGIFKTALAAVEPGEALKKYLHFRGNELFLEEAPLILPEKGRIFVVGAGKAAGVMGAALEDLLGDRIAAGLMVTKEGHGRPLRRITLREAAHPVPDERGVEAAREMEEMLREAGEQDLVFCLLSGGGSALLPAPSEGISLGDKMESTRLLLRSGADITEVNTVRKHLSRFKGGGLARLAAPARLVTLILSDVVGDPLDVVASGPTVPDPSTFGEALEVLDRYGIVEEVPPAIRQRLEKGAAGDLPETPKEGDPLFRHGRTVLIGNNTRAIEAAAVEAKRRGYRPLILSTSVTGETRHVAAVHGAIARENARSGRPAPPPACILSGGETTVTVRGEGKGGRNQEFALAAALEIADLPVVVLSGGTDGTDGPTDAAGALADGTTLQRGRDAGLNPRDHLEENNAYPFFERLGDLLVTGPTGTNVMDIHLVLVAAPEKT